MKFIILIALAGLCTAVGAYFRSGLFRRLVILREIRYMLDEIIILIRFKGATVGEIIEALENDSRLSDLVFLHSVSKNYESGLGFGEAWETAAAGFAANGLKPADQKLIVNIGKNLGTTDTEGQLSSLSLYQNEAETAYTAAETDTLRKAKLYTSMGILTGAFLIVFLI